METIEKFNIKFSYKPNKDTELNPILELYRGKIYANILKSFIYYCTKTFGTKIFSIKKSYPRTITNLLSSWFFTLYSEYDFSGDPFFPNNFTNTDYLKITLLDFVKYDPTLEDVDDKIKNILDNLVLEYDRSLKNLEEYKKSNYFDDKKKCFKITSEKVNQKRGNKHIVFYKYNIDIPFKIRDKRQENIVNNILIPENIYNKLQSRYTGPESKLDEYIWIIIYRYQLLGSNNNQLGVLPHILEKMTNDFGLDYECFASAINATSNNFCSIYHDVEKYFGSYGSFFNLKPLHGVYGFNPPYQKEVMDNGINKILNFIEDADNNNRELTFIITIPIWDNLGRKIMKYTYPEKTRLPVIEYDDFTSINDIFSSKFFKAKLMVSKNKFTYLDHNFHLYKNVTIQNTYILVLSNTDKDFQNILNTYSFCKITNVSTQMDISQNVDV